MVIKGFGSVYTKRHKNKDGSSVGGSQGAVDGEGAGDCG
jgi:hypothetical protein